MNQREAAKNKVDLASPRQLTAVAHPPNREAMTREELLGLVDVALAYGFTAGCQYMDNRRINGEILATIAEIGLRRRAQS